MKSATAVVLAAIFMVICIGVSIFCFVQSSILSGAITLLAGLLTIPIIAKANEKIGRRCLYASVACFLLGATLAPNFTTVRPDTPNAYDGSDVAAMAEMGIFGHDANREEAGGAITIDEGVSMLMPGEQSNAPQSVTSLGNEQIQVHFIDVGQGDCSLIVGNDFAMLIDSGTSGNAEQVISYLNNIGISQLDCVVCTHPHADHIGAMADIMGAFPPSAVILPDIAYDSAAYRNTDAAIAFTGANVIHPAPGASYKLGENGTYFTILGPASTEGASDPDFEINNTSIVLKIVHGQNSFLFTGDIEEDAEVELLQSGQDLSAKVLKVPHHGSTSSSSEQFISAVMPEYAIIQCGADNEYGHPHDAVIRRLSRYRAAIFRNDLDGTIIAASDGENLEWYSDAMPENAS